MSMELMVRAMKAKVGNPLRKLVLIKLADNASDQGECWPSVPYIAEQCEISERSVQNHIKQLVEDGLVSVEVRKAATGLNRTNVYKLNLPSGANAAPSGARPAPGGESPAPVSGAGAAPGTSQFSEPVNEPVNENLFDLAWALYPKRAGGNSKSAALKAWDARVREGVPPLVMLEGVKRYAGFVAQTGKTGTEFVKQAKTFFGPDMHYEDDWMVPASYGIKEDPLFKSSYVGTDYSQGAKGFRVVNG
ncbi:helix-turn-helix domain-containing protein [Leclercia adecarboxylata]|uniref:helix-turn-helix domain-containing protein n=1 Tax=Leclercia adecarboxylata TaxID=83655 RepID=UPI0027CC37E8|nr:helix-turn-helix domain-containing protein [Leclercia adecarboxylata]MDQ2130599.1 helix-turn-helix domain-containing protein [Leclercia adecarboxylata]MDV7058983.1 helix-turn-helix domain-containing protein [Leclercia adecarboxylata]